MSLHQQVWDGGREGGKGAGKWAGGDDLRGLFRDAIDGLIPFVTGRSSASAEIALWSLILDREYGGMCEAESLPVLDEYVLELQAASERFGERQWPIIRGRLVADLAGQRLIACEDVCLIMRHIAARLRVDVVDQDVLICLSKGRVTRGVTIRRSDEKGMIVGVCVGDEGGGVAVDVLSHELLHALGGLGVPSGESVFRDVQDWLDVGGPRGMLSDGEIQHCVIIVEAEETASWYLGVEYRAPRLWDRVPPEGSVRDAERVVAIMAASNAWREYVRGHLSFTAAMEIMAGA